MEISKRSPFSGEVNTRNLDITVEQFDRWNRGESVQNVFPHLSATDREFLLTGITDEDWPSDPELVFDE